MMETGDRRNVPHQSTHLRRGHFLRSLLFLLGFGPAGQGSVSGDFPASLRRKVLAALLSALPPQIADVLPDAGFDVVRFGALCLSPISWHSNSLAACLHTVKNQA
jgi:hypothetical protein